MADSAQITIHTGATDAQIAAWLADVLTKGLVRAKGDIAICLPGGSTPFPILAELVRFPLDWARIVVWPGDDR
ncbi:MAG: hypothetical protein RLY97_2300, partial [Pseudomonadota bacterium]